MPVTMDRHQGKIEVWIAVMKNGLKETMACKETTEAGLECEKPTSVDMESKQRTRRSLRKMP
jgi:hypothetical protein